MPSRIKWMLAGAVGLALIAAVVAMRGGKEAEPGDAEGPTVAVTRGPLVVSVTEAGEVEAERRMVVANELKWAVTIKSVVDEGTRVRDGDVIVAFECRELEEAITQHKINKSAAEDEYVSAREELTLKRKETDHNVRKAEQALEDASEALVRYREGEAPNLRRDAESEIRLAERDLALAQDKLEFKLKVNEDPSLNSPYSTKEIEAERLQVQRLELALEQAKAARDILVKYDHPRQLRQLQAAVEEAKLGLERARLEQKTQLMAAEAKARAKKLRLDLETKRLTDALEAERKLVVKAEREGIVVYDVGGNRYRPSDVTVAAGEKINPRQQLMIIPDMTSLVIKTRVYESVINQVKPGLPAYVRLDSDPDRPLEAKVTKVAVLPDSQHRWLNPGVKVYEVVVELDGIPERLKPGMTARTELVLARLDNVLSLPIAAVFSEGQRTYCWKATADGVDRVPIQVGRMNDTRVEVAAGLKAGDRVLLAHPDGEQSKMEEGGETPKAEPGREPPKAEPGGKAGETPARGSGGGNGGGRRRGGKRNRS